MSEPKPPVMPDDDRELEDFLAGRSELSRLYRQDAAEIKAPEALDAAVLRAAQSSVPAAKAKPARLRRWRLPLSLAASMVIGIAVLREVPREPALPVASEAMAVTVETPPPPAPEAAMMAPPHAAAAPLPEQAEARKKSLPSAKPSRVMPDAAVAGSPPPPEALKPEASQQALRARSAAKAAAPLMAESEAKADDVAWRPARYRGLQLGNVTVAEWQRRIGHPAVTSAPSGNARLAADAMTPAKPVAEPQLVYGPGIDPRGSLRAELDPQRQRVDTVILELTPALTLQDVEQAEALSGTARQESESALLSDQTACREARAPRPDQGRVASRVYPERGIELRLDGDGRVTEIRYLAVRPESAC
ncbi:hypothetical protein [uncultured Nevskia sp.]|uniref:hypothetical protein n=1 Tax=uncultured Nevskia sp. TaxID=228950 RepID=UPI0025F896EF|nr:hypothetical protein [uncultured Nevskia sp.]